MFAEVPKRAVWRDRGAPGVGGAAELDAKRRRTYI